MLHRIIATVLAIVSAGQVAAAPMPRGADQRPEPYFPIRVGTKWVYQQSAWGQMQKDETEMIREVKHIGKLSVVTVAETSPAGDFRSMLAKIRVSLSGLDALDVGCVEDHFQHPLLQVAPIPDRSLNYEYTEESIGFKLRHTGTVRMLEPEAIKVPAGTFTAIPVVRENRSVNDKGVVRTFKMTCWYAPGVGEVKRVWGDEGQFVRELKLFVPGKE